MIGRRMWCVLGLGLAVNLSGCFDPGPMPQGVDGADTDGTDGMGGETEGGGDSQTGPDSGGGPDSTAGSTSGPGGDTDDDASPTDGDPSVTTGDGSCDPAVWGESQWGVACWQ